VSLLFYNCIVIFIKSSPAISRVNWLRITDVSRGHHQGCDVTVCPDNLISVPAQSRCSTLSLKGR